MRRPVSLALLPLLAVASSSPAVARTADTQSTTITQSGALELSLGEVSVRAAGKGDALAREVRSALETALKAVDLKGATATGRYVVGASLTQLEASGGQGKCTLSVSLRSPAGTVIASIHGKAQADGPLDSTLERELVRVAAKSAAEGVGKILRSKAR
jgi:hypothetical protein